MCELKLAMEREARLKLPVIQRLTISGNVSEDQSVDPSYVRQGRGGYPHFSLPSVD